MKTYPDPPRTKAQLRSLLEKEIEEVIGAAEGRYSDYWDSGDERELEKAQVFLHHALDTVFRRVTESPLTLPSKSCTIFLWTTP